MFETFAAMAVLWSALSGAAAEGTFGNAVEIRGVVDCCEDEGYEEEENAEGLHVEVSRSIGQFQNV